MAHLSLEPILSVSMELYQSLFGPAVGREEAKLDASFDIVRHKGLSRLDVHVTLVDLANGVIVEPFGSFSNSITTSLNRTIFKI